MARINVINKKNRAWLVFDKEKNQSRGSLNYINKPLIAKLEKSLKNFSSARLNLPSIKLKFHADVDVVKKLEKSNEPMAFSQHKINLEMSHNG
jgi:hypothetical protein